MQYQPGLHILAEFKTDKQQLLHSGKYCHELFDTLIQNYNLHKVGEVYHDFEGGGFTAVVCLTESHISIHTWPEFGLATFDVFLSNYRHDNSDKARALFNGVIAYFEADVVKQQEVIR